jgi:hypothetical protein
VSLPPPPLGGSSLMAPAAGPASATAAAERHQPNPVDSAAVALASLAVSGPPAEPGSAAASTSLAASASTSAASLASSSQEAESQLDDLVWLEILRGLGEDAPLVHARVSPCG